MYYTVLDRTQESKERSLCGVGRCIPKALEHEDMLEREPPTTCAQSL